MSWAIGGPPGAGARITGPGSARRSAPRLNDLDLSHGAARPERIAGPAESKAIRGRGNLKDQSKHFQGARNHHQGSPGRGAGRVPGSVARLSAPRLNDIDLPHGAGPARSGSPARESKEDAGERRRIILQL